MNITNVTSEQAAQCLELLESAAEPMVAADIAFKLGLSGSRETQRRHVRAIIRYLRDNGSMVIATLHEGYWLTTDTDLWRDYLEGRQIDAKRILGKTHRQKKMLADGHGQGLLFEKPRIRCGVATIGIG